MGLPRMFAPHRPLTPRRSNMRRCARKSLTPSVMLPLLLPLLLVTMPLLSVRLKLRLRLIPSSSLLIPMAMPLLLPGCLFPRRCAEILCRKYYNLTGNTDKTLLQKEHLMKLVHLSNFIIIFYNLKCENLRTYIEILPFHRASAGSNKKKDTLAAPL